MGSTHRTCPRSKAPQSILAGSLAAAAESGCSCHANDTAQMMRSRRAGRALGPARDSTTLSHSCRLEQLNYPRPLFCAQEVSALKGATEHAGRKPCRHRCGIRLWSPRKYRVRAVQANVRTTTPPNKCRSRQVNYVRPLVSRMEVSTFDPWWRPHIRMYVQDWRSEIAVIAMGPLRGKVAE